MSLSSALNTSVSSLQAQSALISAVSENIANSSTIGYKTKEVDFASLVTGTGSNASGGVIYSTAQDMTTQGLIQSTGSATDAAINGNGFFVVSSSLNNQPSGYTYSRNGSFSPDATGDLVNSEGYYLMGWPTDENGNVTADNKNDLNSLVPVSVSSVQGAARATSNITMDLNLPANATAGQSFNTSTEIFDSLGVSHNVQETWTKSSTDPNTWELDFSQPYDGTDSSTPTGTLSPTSMTVVFNGDGTLQSIDGGSTATPLSITGWTSGASDSSINLNLGTVGKSDGLTQYASTLDTPDIEITKMDQDGLRLGKLSSVAIGSDGTVTATFDNGLKKAMYKIPVATFPDPSQLTHVNGSIYDENLQAGVLTLQEAGTGAAGVIAPSSLEESTTDTSEEFNKMIVAQQAYSASSQVINTVGQMFDSLMQALR